MAIDSRAQKLLEDGDHLFDKRLPLLSLWQCIAESFYPERGGFTVTHSLGDEFADHLTTSYPLMARRELGNALSSMLRPSSKEWFSMTTARPDKLDKDGLAWLQWAGALQRRAMFDRHASFVRATKEGDHDFATFGQPVLSVELDRRTNTLLYRCWHLRDVAWCENVRGEIDTVHRKWPTTPRQAVSLFGDKCHPKMKEKAEKQPYCDVEIRHIIVPTEYYEPVAGKNKPKQPYMSIYIDCENQHVIEETPSWTKHYVIPRWQTVPGSQYAFSPAAIAALPDARLIQSMAYSLMQAGEKAVTPPLIATKEAVRSDVQVFAGGITWIDDQYDERLGEALRPINQDLSGIPIGLDMQRDTREMIAQAFFLNKLNMPQPDHEMTAYETAQRMQEYIRQAMPLFEPVEQEYNGALCEDTFEIILRNDGFGSLDDMPESLRDAEVQFKFESPLQEATERIKGQRFQEAGALIAAAVQLDPRTAAIPNASVALRDALNGIGVPAMWINSEEQVAQIEQQQQQQQQQQQMLATLERGAGVAADMGKASQAFATANAQVPAAA
jgi:hypothetical protein